MKDSIDLTLNRDFWNNSDTWIDYLNRDLARAALNIEDEETVSMEQHAKLNLFESFFGAFMRNEYWKVREQWIIPDFKVYQAKCVRCGKIIKIPWGRLHQILCNECFNKSADFTRLPWRLDKEADNNVASELFALR